MKNNGFTLIELLGVIIILALLAILVFPNVINSVKKSTDKTNSLTKNLIYSASNTYISNHKGDFPKDNGNKFSINLIDLVNEELLVSPIKYEDSDDITNTKCVQATYNDGTFSYELKNSGSCESFILKICKLQEGTSQEVGSKYNCKLDEERTFYVLENNELSDNISLIMDRNLPDPVAWCSDTTLCKTDGNWDSTKGSITANAYIASQTSDWGVDVSLPTYNQILNANDGSENLLKSWLLANLNSSEFKFYCYWTSTPVGSSSNIWYVAKNVKSLKDNFNLSGTLSVRPVITIPKTRLY